MGKNAKRTAKPLELMPKPAEIQRFLNKVILDPETECWMWQGYISPKGYGQFSFRGRMHWAHRWARQVWRGKLAVGKHGHHECRNTSCVNPDHIIPMNGSLNTAIGNSSRRSDIPF
jgi:hypothetical protein